MKHLLIILATACLFPLTASAHGPSPQKVVKEIIIKAEPAKVWAAIKDFGGIHQWHPAVADTRLEQRKDADSDAMLSHRILMLKDGGSIVEKLREASDAEMKLDYKMVEGTIPVSNYRAVMQVKAGPAVGESTLTWTGRFYNKANSMEARPGEDNPAANAAINGIYDAGLAGLKKLLEQSLSDTSISGQIPM